MKYAYYPGCSLHSSAKDYDLSTRAMCQRLGIDLHELSDWICCGASSAHMTSELLSLALPVKNLLLAKSSEDDVAVACAACYSRLSMANGVMRNGRGDRRVHDVDMAVGATYRGEVGVKHLIEILARDYGLEQLQKTVTRPLSGLKVACYYGCLLVRPKSVAFDDPENPSLMDKLVTAIGAQPVEWSHKTECCGGSLALSRTDIVLKLCRDILEKARDAGADCLMVGCPLCQANLDMRQAQVNKRYGTNLNMPILYFTQLVGLALDLTPKELGLSALIVSPQNMLEAKVFA